MAAPTQANRPIRVDTELGADALLLNGFSGTEGMSRPFAFQLELLSTQPDIDADAILRTPVLVSMRLPDGGVRRIHGIVSRFSQLGMRDELAFYRAEIVPWLWFLRLSRESRIYQDLSIPDILEQVFQRAGYADFELRLTRAYAERTYCVQYRESHFDFVSRLMEEEGIFYYFEHADEKHVLVLCDDNGASEPAPAAEIAHFAPDTSHAENVISELEHEHSVHPSMVTLWDYDYLQPTLKLHTSEGEDDAEEVYDYPGRYAEPDDGERIARLLLEAEEAERRVVRGESTARGLMPGCHFTLRAHYRRDMNAQYLITEVQHFASAGGYRAWQDDAGLEYRNGFLAIPFETPYRPRRRTPRPIIGGSQSALVVGPAGEEVYVDKHGRIKVQFYWDRDGTRNENSSCWIRVATPWGGKGWGAVSIPRIGNEVLVAFEEGDPDRPIIVGSVYNADQTPPFALPGAGIQMGMRSRSSKGGGGHNEITMTDTKGKELVNIHAQYDMSTTVLHDDRQTVKNDRTIKVDGKHTETIKKATAIEVTEGNYTFVVKTGTATVEVKGEVKETYKASQLTDVAKNIALQAGDKITLLTGASSIELHSDGTIKVIGKSIAIEGTAEVRIEAPKVAISGGDEVKLGVGNQQATFDKMKVATSGAAINSSAVGMHEIAGAVVKIN